MWCIQSRFLTNQTITIWFLVFKISIPKLKSIVYNSPRNNAWPTVHHAEAVEPDELATKRNHRGMCRVPWKRLAHWRACRTQAITIFQLCLLPTWHRKSQNLWRRKRSTYSQLWSGAAQVIGFHPCTSCSRTSLGPGILQHDLLIGQQSDNVFTVVDPKTLQQWQYLSWMPQSPSGQSARLVSHPRAGVGGRGAWIILRACRASWLRACKVFARRWRLDCKCGTMCFTLHLCIEMMWQRFCKGVALGFCLGMWKILECSGRLHVGHFGKF